jgi:hypothetical protein
MHPSNPNAEDFALQGEAIFLRYRPGRKGLRKAGIPEE